MEHDTRSDSESGALSG